MIQHIYKLERVIIEGHGKGAGPQLRMDLS